MQLRGKMTPELAAKQGEVDAKEAMKVCVKSLEGSMKQLNTRNTGKGCSEPFRDKGCYQSRRLSHVARLGIGIWTV
jgi:hypothetical protein